ncbi:MAG: arginyl aminopeptidase, partial [Bacteroidota bacterium]
MRIIFLSFVLFFSLPVCFGQDIDYARRIISDLSAPEFHGRGFTSKGEKKAAVYLKSELERMNIQALGNGYFQEFSVPVNTL